MKRDESNRVYWFQTRFICRLYLSQRSSFNLDLNDTSHHLVAQDQTVLSPRVMVTWHKTKNCEPLLSRAQEPKAIDLLTRWPASVVRPSACICMGTHSQP